jgi:signal transduction histidine kinase
MPFSREIRRTIWIVDDSSTDAERVRRLLVSEYNVEVMTDGAMALERLASGAGPDLLLLDWVMPGISGVEVCQYVRSSPHQVSKIPIILLTAQHGTDEIIQAFKSGANDYVSKPFVEEELKARVVALLASKSLLERAEKAEKDLTSLLTTAPDPTFAIDKDGKITFVNAEGTRILNRPHDEIIRKSFQSLIPGVALDHVRTGKSDLTLPLSDVQIGERIYSPSVRILPSNNSSSTTVALRDVSERRRMEARRLDFYSVIAHDLRTPITAVLLRLQMAFRGKHGILPAGLLSDLQRSDVNLRSLVGMINDFLEIAKLEGLGYKINREPVEIGKLLKTTIEDFQPLLEKNELKWTEIGLENESTVFGDPQRLTQVFSNILGNAIKFTPASGKIETKVTTTHEFVEVSVQDTGRGIDESEIPHLFERFTRANASASDTPGTGLGLMIVREIVEAHGGLIGVESKLGEGSRFWFRLPHFQGTSSLAV